MQLNESYREPVYIMIPDFMRANKNDDAANGCDNSDADYEACQKSPPGEFKVEENPCYCKMTQ